MLKAQGFDILSMPVGPVSLVPDSNNPDSPLSKKKVREAVSYAINRDAIVKARGFGFWSAANQIPSPGQLGQQFPVRPFPLAYYVTYPGSIGYLRLYLPSHVGNTPLFEATAREKTAKRSDFVRTLRPDR